MKMRPATEKKDGIILPGATAYARRIGLLKDRFTTQTFLWKREGEVYISFVETHSPGQGHFRELVENLLKMGYVVKIPTPLGRMEHLVQSNGYTKTIETTPHGDPCEVYVKTPGGQGR